MNKTHLSVSALKQVHEILVLAKHYDAMLTTIRASLVTLVQDETGINLSDGDWNLDTDTGVIEHVTTD